MQRKTVKFMVLNFLPLLKVLLLALLFFVTLLEL